MGLTLTVGNPTDLFTEPFGVIVTDTLRAHFGDTIELESPLEPHYSEELGWSGWRELQERAINTLGANATPHFLSMEAWHGAYLPVETEMGAFSFSENNTPLDVASLEQLILELENLAEALELPVDDEGLQRIAARYNEDDELIDDDMDIQMLAALLPCARLAKERNQVLWVIK